MYLCERKTIQSFYVMPDIFRVFLLVIFLSNGIGVQSQQLTNLPTFYIATDGSRPITSKTTWLPAQLSIVSSDTAELISAPMTIRGRGNSTWNMAKKPYRIKMEQKTRLLNLPAREKDWVLLANHADKTLIRNAVAFKIGSLLGFEFTPSARFADVVINNQFVGNYMLTDQVERGDLRVRIEKLDSTLIDQPALSGGYLLEIDGFATSEPVWFTSSQALKITVKYPDDDEITPGQLNYIRSFTNSFENALFSSNFNDPLTGYRPMVDTTSLINWYLASELTGNPDCFWSTYLYKRRSDDRFYFGPLWDYDIAFNNDHRLGDAVNSLMRDKAFNPRQWIRRFWEDDWFRLAVNRRWKELIQSGLEDSLIKYIDATVLLLDASQYRNFDRWPVLSTKVYNEQFLFPTYEQGVDYLKSYLRQRISFLTASFESTQPEIPTPAFSVEPFYYRILNKGTNNAIDVADNATSVLNRLYMWAPQEEDLAQQWIIRQLNTGNYQFINRNSGLAMMGNGRAVHLIQQLPDSSDKAQQWKIVPLFSGDIYGLENVLSGYSVNNSGGNTANGTAVIEYDNNMLNLAKTNQHWYLQKVEKLDVNTGTPRFCTARVMVYPNPASEFIQIKNDGDKEIRVQLYLPDGRLLLTESCLAAKTTTLQLSRFNLNPGILLLRMSSSEGVQTFKIQLK